MFELHIFNVFPSALSSCVALKCESRLNINREKFKNIFKQKNVFVTGFAENRKDTQRNYVCFRFTKMEQKIF